MKVKPCVWLEKASNWTFTEEITLFQVFLLLAPQLATEYSVSAAAQLLAYNFSQGKPLRSKWPLPFNLLNAWLTDLMALGLVEPSMRKHAVTDTESYWTLTKEGRDAHSWLRNLELEKRTTEAKARVSENSDTGQSSSTITREEPPSRKKARTRGKAG